MKLRTLARLSLSGAIIGLAILVLYGAILWRDLDRHVSAGNELDHIQERIFRLTSVIDYTTLLRADQEIIRGAVEDVRDLMDRVRRLDDGPATRRVVAHLGEVAYMGDHLLDYLARNGGSGNPFSETMLSLSRQIRIHQNATKSALHELISERRQAITATQNAALASLLAITLLFALLGVLAFWLIHQRISRPVRAMNDALQSLAAGNLEARIALDGQDELAMLAGSFNNMARQLGERMKELRCLYQVLETTTGMDTPLNDIFRKVVEILPTSLQYPDHGVARIVAAGESVSDPRWREPVTRLSAPIAADRRVEGKIEIGYLVDHGFLEEEKELLDSVALHLSRMLQARRLSEALTRGERLRAVGEMTGGIAHDFNNLLTVVLGNAELLQEQLEGVNEDQAGLAEMIASAAERGAELTGRLLAFARRQPLAPEQVNINQLIGGTEKLLRRSMGEQFEVEVVRGAGLWEARIDPGQLENALLNLAINARDAMGEGGKLTIETANMWLNHDYADQHNEVEPGQYVMLAVSDTGSGIPHHIQDRVFEPFFTTKETGRGTGLGLSMVYGFIKQSGGHIKVYSEPGEGTTIRMYLPRMVGERDRAAAEQRPQDDTSGGSGIILLVEDDLMVRRIAREQLTAMGYQVIEADNGPQALEIIRRRDDIDLLFTDVVMPGGLSGRQLADAARQIRPLLRVLYTSGYTENAIVHQGRLDPDVRLLSKPYRKAELARQVREILGRGND